MAAKLKCEGVVVTVGPKTGYGFDKKKQRWYCCYKNRGKLERRYVDATNAEDAIRARDEIFAAMLMQGAVRKGGREERERKVRVRRDPGDPMAGITMYHIKVRRYRIRVGRRIIGTRKTQAAAIKLRDAWVEVHEWKPCESCGKRPVFSRDKNLHGRLKHQEPGCPNQLFFRRVGREEVLQRWNSKLFKQKPES